MIEFFIGILVGTIISAAIGFAIYIWLLRGIMGPFS